MKIRRRVTALLIAMNLMAMLEVTSLRAQPAPGSYRRIATNEKEVRKAAKYAVKQEQRKSEKRYSLRNIVSAERQVVAGLNYRLCLNLKSDGEEKTAEAVIYKNLQQQYALTSWEWKECKQ